MSGEVLNGLFSLAGVLIGSVTSVVGILISNRINRKKQHIAEAFDQIAGYWNLEEEMAKRIAELEEKKRAVKTIKEDFRDIVYKNKGIRPTMTEAEANRIKNSVLR